MSGGTDLHCSQVASKGASDGQPYLIFGYFHRTFSNTPIIAGLGTMNNSQLILTLSLHILYRGIYGGETATRTLAS